MSAQWPSRPLAPGVPGLLDFWASGRRWLRDRLQRSALAELDDHLLDDIGIGRQKVGTAPSETDRIVRRLFLTTYCGRL